MGNVEVSIIVPVYNVAPYLDKCVKSLVNQTCKNIEILLIDDGSTDDSGKLCGKWADTDSRVKVYHIEKSGVSVARNKGMKESSGKWICFVDADDWCDANYIEELVKYAEAGASDIFIGGFTAEYSDYSGQDAFFKFDEYSFLPEDKTLLIASCFVHTAFSQPGSVTNVGVPWGKIYRADFLRKNDLSFVPGLERMQDTIFNLYAFDAAERVNYKRLYTYHYRKNIFASTVGYRPDFSNTIIKVDAEIERFINKSQRYELKEARRCKTVALINEMVRLQFASGKNKASVFEKTKKINDFLNVPVFSENIKNCKGTYLTGKSKISLFLMKHHLSFPLLIYKRAQVIKDEKKIYR